MVNECTGEGWELKASNQRVNATSGDASLPRRDEFMSLKFGFRLSIHLRPFLNLFARFLFKVRSTKGNILF